MEPNTFKEIWEVEKPATPKFNERCVTMANNPMLSSRQRLNSVSNAFSMDNLSQQNGAGSKRGKLLQKNLHGETVNNTSNNPLGKSVIKRAGKS